MKKITFVFFTFSGIYTGLAQKQADMKDTGNTQKSPPAIADSISRSTGSSVRVYPNPAKNKVEIEIKGFNPGYVQVQLINIDGKRVRDENRLVISGNEIIVFMFSENPGLYILLLKQGEKNVRQRLLIR